MISHADEWIALLPATRKGGFAGLRRSSRSERRRVARNDEAYATISM